LLAEAAQSECAALDARSEGQSGDSLLKENEQAKPAKRLDALRCASVRIDWGNPEK